MMPRYRVAVVGMGKRGMHHATAFAANPRFELVGISSRDQKRLDAAAAKLQAEKKLNEVKKLGDVTLSTDARALAAEVKPDVFCFCTPPNVRLPLIQIGIAGGAKLIAFEKPVAMTSAEGLAVKHALDKAGVKAVVSHQHRYGEHYRKVKEIIAGDRLGGPHAQPSRGLHVVVQ